MTDSPTNLLLIAVPALDKSGVEERNLPGDQRQHSEESGRRMRIVARGAALLLVAASLATAGCHSDSRSRSSSPWSGLLADVRDRWESDGTVDLTSGAAVPLRAYIESRTLAQSWGSLDHTYPGFLDAVPPNAEPGSGNVGERNRRPNTEHPLDSARFGTSHYFIQSLARAGQTVLATVCNYRYSIAKQQANGLFQSVAATEPGPDRGIDALRVTLVAPQPERAALPRQNGPAPSPGVDVFAGWQITGFLGPLSNVSPEFAVLWPTYEEDTQKCVARAPDNEARRTTLTQGEHPRDDFPTLPPSPGWPEAPSQ